MTASCDGCSLCCKLLSVAELDKPACTWCSKVERTPRGRGCGIYPERPLACKTFECLWLASQSRRGQEMQSELRPDRSHVVFAMDMHVMPANEIDPDRRCLIVHVDPDFPNAWRARLPTMAIRRFQERGGTVLIHIGGEWSELRSGDSMKCSSSRMLQFMLSPNIDPWAGMPKPILDPDELMKRRA